MKEELKAPYSAKWQYHKDHGGVICNSAEEEAGLGAGWSDTCAEFDPNPSATNESLMRPKPIHQFLGKPAAEPPLGAKSEAPLADLSVDPEPKKKSRKERALV